MLTTLKIGKYFRSGVRNKDFPAVGLQTVTKGLISIMAFTTRKSLLAKVRGGDEVSWQEFYAAYKPLILLCGADCGLDRDEKDELVQKVMCEIFCKDIVGKFEGSGTIFVRLSAIRHSK